MRAARMSPRRVAARAQSRLFYVTLSEKGEEAGGGRGGLEMCDETERKGERWLWGGEMGGK